MAVALNDILENSKLAYPVKPSSSQEILTNSVLDGLQSVRRRHSKEKHKPATWGLGWPSGGKEGSRGSEHTSCPRKSWLREAVLPLEFLGKKLALKRKRIMEGGESHYLSQ